jgi:hypothetical protein
VNIVSRFHGLFLMVDGLLISFEGILMSRVVTTFVQEARRQGHRPSSGMWRCKASKKLIGTGLMYASGSMHTAIMAMVSLTKRKHREPAAYRVISNSDGSFASHGNKAERDSGCECRRSLKFHGANELSIGDVIRHP